MKVCSVCKEEKDLSEFYKAPSRSGGYTTRCKSCDREKQREWRSRPSSQEKNKLRYRRRLLRERYGLTLEDYQSMYDKQDGRCAICGDPPDSKNGNLNVDHCHTTGKVRGLLCSSCNLGIGKLKDDVSILQKAIAYLEDTH